MKFVRGLFEKAERMVALGFLMLFLSCGCSFAQGFGDQNCSGPLWNMLRLLR